MNVQKNIDIAITGVGATTPYGVGTDKLWESLLESESAISEMDLFDLNGIACTKAGVIRNFIPPAGFEKTMNILSLKICYANWRNIKTLP